MKEKLIEELELLRDYNQKGNLEPRLKLLIDYIDKLEKEKEQLKTILGNQVRIKDELSEKIKKIRELVENSDWRLDDVHDLIDGYNEIAKIIN